ncbi:MAG: hydroxypyruvate isomerase [Rhodospirillales bacterium]|nr:hydroxypyruvate isomerase [Rhodospirillales bacterium]MCW8969826.1 hydroxypyruvate isomerase [Rhodospirillales bacterium]MCW9003180.1 hydroxypyruvate isomerase [Rhodospirillales bacterium]
MPRLDANITMMFTEFDFLDRFAEAAKAGFTGVECQFPYAYPAEALAGRLRSAGLTMALHNLPAGDWAAGERGIACMPDRVAEFREGVKTAIVYAKALGCRQVNCIAGVLPAGGDRREALDVLAGNLRHAAGELKDAGIRLLLEPINDRDVPGFLINTTGQALDVLDAVGSDNLFLQCDLYHMAMMGEDIPAVLATHMERIAHFQIADCPGRHEPGTGTIPFNDLFALIDDLGYGGWIGCEYLPADGTHEGLDWITPYRKSGRVA